MQPFSFQNVIAGDGIGITITGMLIVFVSLGCISICIGLLPKILDLLDKKSSAPEQPVAAAKPQVSASEQEEDEIATAIGLVVHMEMERISAADNQRITIEKSADNRSMWAAAGKMKTFTRRGKYA